MTVYGACVPQCVGTSDGTMCRVHCLYPTWVPDIKLGWQACLPGSFPTHHLVGLSVLGMLGIHLDQVQVSASFPEPVCSHPSPASSSTVKFASATYRLSQPQVNRRTILPLGQLQTLNLPGKKRTHVLSLSGNPDLDSLLHS